jgi:tetratricopeptide (TPR) repeat protein
MTSSFPRFRQILRAVALLLCLSFVPTAVQGQSNRAEKLEQKKRQAIQAREFEIEQKRKAFTAEAARLRKEAIKQLKEILNENPDLDDSQRAEMLMRLADLYLEESQYQFFQAMEEYNQALDSYYEKATDARGEEPVLDDFDTRSAVFTRKAVDQYSVILKSYPKYRRVDHALFYQAMALNDLGKKKEALDAFSRLVTTYPDSDFVPDGYNQIGEYWFNEKNNAFKALQAYRKASAHKESKIYTFALYKLGWCYFNVGEYETAIRTMQDVVSETERILRDTGQSGGISLKDEALKDLVGFYAEGGDLDEARAYFRQVGEDQYYRKLLGRLGSIYFEQGKNDEAVETYRLLIAENPSAPDNPQNHDQIIRAYWERDQYDRTNEAIQELIDTYAKGTRWSKDNAEDKDALVEADLTLEKRIRNTAIEYHRRSKKERTRRMHDYARIMYSHYAEHFPAHENTYNMRFWLAEVLYDQGTALAKKKEVAASSAKLEEAVGHYEWVRDKDTKGKHLQKSAVNVYFAIEQILKPIQAKAKKERDKIIKEQKKSGANPQEIYAPVALLDWEQRLVQSIDRYAALLPDHKDTPGLLYNSAYLLYEANHFQDANQRFRDLIREHGKTELAQNSVHLVLDSYTLIEDWTNLNTVAREFYNNPEVGTTEKFRTELKDIYENATLKIAEVAAAGGEHKDAGDKFLAFFEEFPDSKNASLALYNAAFYHNSAGDRRGSLAERLRFLEVFPEAKTDDDKKRKMQEKNVAVLAAHYESIADFGNAATYYKELYDRDQEFEIEGFTSAKDALYNAALFREALGRWEEAVPLYEEWLEKFPGEEPPGPFKLRLAGLFRDGGKSEEAMARFKALYTDPELASDLNLNMTARSEYLDLLHESGVEESETTKFERESLNVYAKAAKGKEQSDEILVASQHAAKMRFSLLEEDYAAYKAIELSADKKQAAKALKGKSDGLDTMVDKYTAVLEMRAGEWGIAALYMIGESYHEFARALLNSPRPPGLTDDQYEIYKYGLEDKAYPVQDKAVDAYKRALDKSYELSIYSPFTQLAFKALSKERPNEYPEQLEELLEPAYTASTYDTSSYSLDGVE